MAGVLAHRALIARAHGRYDEALALAQESLELARRAGDDAAAAYAWFRLGLIAGERGEFSLAEDAYNECLACYKTLGDATGMALALLGLGDIARDQADVAMLEAYCSESLSRCRHLGRPFGVGFSLNNLGLAAAMRGDLARADGAYRRGSGPVPHARDQGRVARALGHIGTSGVREWRVRPGQEAVAGRPIKRVAGGPYWKVATTLEELARVMVAEGDAATAAMMTVAAQAWRERMGAPVPPYRRETVDAILSAVQDTLGDDAFATGRKEWEKLRPEAVVSVALRFTEDERPAAPQRVGRRSQPPASCPPSP